ncbi:MAG TPA: hypothetical protein VN283_13960 [Thiobacillus sp.]|nr:hypothetical protein [Thiobacillus sp.]
MNDSAFSLPARSTAAAPLRVWWRLKSLPYDHIRDAVLVIAGLQYLLGYIVWSLHAWHNNLGLLPPLDAQYLLAGFIVVSILLSCAAIAWGIHRVSELIPGTLSRERAHTGWRKVLRLSWYLVACTSLAAMLGLPDVNWEKWRQLSTVIFVICAYLSPALEGEQHSASRIPLVNALGALVEGYFRLARGFMIPLAIIIFTLLIMAVAINYYTQHWPQELAGPKPRCAYLDLDTSKVSPTTLTPLLPASARTEAHARVVRSGRLNVFFTGETLLAKPENAAQRTNETYEISKSAVAAITWCTP